LATRRRHLRRSIDEARERWTAGPPQPSPGYRCGTCPVADLCRAGAGAR
jgi:CRISPR/Cas system-associated exonuclease Cas4 (RecB family)